MKSAASPKNFERQFTVTSLQNTECPIVRASTGAHVGCRSLYFRAFSRQLRIVVFSGLLILGDCSLSRAQDADAVVAVVDGQQITLRQVDDSVSSQVFPLKQQLFAVRKVALSNLVISTVLQAEARKRGISTEELRKELTRGAITVSKSQVDQAYSENAPFFALMSPDEAKERLRMDLENQARMRLFKDGLENLKSKLKVAVLLEQPPAFATLDDGLSPSKGSKTSPVTIFEFSDFQCPFCSAAQGVLKTVLEKYGNRVRLVFKNLPLEGHRNAFNAARAAYCAAAQDRFWQYHDALFTTRDLSSNQLRAIAGNLGLNTDVFQQCLLSEQSRAAILKDIESARLLQVDSTPSFVINGNVVKGAIGFAEFERMIERELTRLSGAKASSTN